MDEKQALKGMIPVLWNFLKKRRKYERSFNVTMTDDECVISLIDQGRKKIMRWRFENNSHLVENVQSQLKFY